MNRQTQYYAWFIWFLAALFYSLEFFQRIAPSVIIHHVEHAFSLSETRFAAITALYYQAYAIAQIPVGILVDRFGTRIPLAAGAFILAAGAYLFGSADAAIPLAIGRICVGIGSAFAFIACLKIAASYFAQNKFALVVGLTNTLGVLGGIFGQEPLSYLVMHVGWRESLQYSGLFSLLLAFLIYTFVRDRQTTTVQHRYSLNLSPKHIANQLLILVKSPQSWLIALYASLMVAPIIGFVELWAVNFLEVNYHLDSIAATHVNQFVLIGIAVGGPVNGYVSDRLNNRKAVMMLGNIMAILSLFALILGDHFSPAILMILSFAFGFFTSSMLLCFSLHAEKYDTSFSGTVIAFTNMLIMLIGAGFQVVIGYLSDQLHARFGASISDAVVLREVNIIFPICLCLNLILLYCINTKSHHPSKDDCHQHPAG